MAYDPAKPFEAQTGKGGSPYDAVRQKATKDAGNQEAQGLDAITRRFAAMGNLNSGSYVKAQEELSRQAQERNQDAQGKIDMAEVQGALPYAEMEQKESQFGRQLGQQESQFGRELPLKQRQLDLEASQQALDAHANDLNYELGQYQSQHSGGLFGGGGFLGIGGGGGGGGFGNAGDIFKNAVPVSNLWSMKF